MKKVLIYSGTGDGLKLAAALVELPNLEVISSLAGRTQSPTLPPGRVRIGGFGGVAGLVSYLEREKIDLSIDLTHPFASKMSWNAATAAKQCQIPHLIFDRPAWQPESADRWLPVDSIQAAANLLSSSNFQRVFLTIGRQEIDPFIGLANIWFLTRSIEPPSLPHPNGEILLARGPFSVESEIALLQQYRIKAIVTKNSGGDATYAKIIAARSLDIPVVIVQRSILPAGERVSTKRSAIEWVKSKIQSRQHLDPSTNSVHRCAP